MIFLIKDDSIFLNVKEVRLLTSLSLKFFTEFLLSDEYVHIFVVMKCLLLDICVYLDAEEYFSESV